MPILSNAGTIQALATEWSEVEILRGKLQRSILFAFAQGAIGTGFLGDAAYNLPMIHAFGVLNNALLAIRDEGVFAQKGWQLGALMKASKAAIPWRDIAAMESAVDRRNDVAHRGDVLPRGESWQYIDLIEAQLKAWGLI